MQWDGGKKEKKKNLSVIVFLLHLGRKPWWLNPQPVVWQDDRSSVTLTPDCVETLSGGGREYACETTVSVFACGIDVAPR